MFLQILRIYYDGSWHHSVQYFFLSDYTSVDTMRLAADARYHNIIAADLQNAAVTYNAAYIIDNGGNMLEKDIFDRRVVESTSAEA